MPPEGRRAAEVVRRQAVCSRQFPRRAANSVTRKTLLTQRSSSHYKDLFVRLLSPLFVRDVERAMTTNLATLQGLVEAEPSVVAPHPMPGQKGFHGCCAPELPSPSP